MYDKWQVENAKKCPCRGADDYCVCQNDPDCFKIKTVKIVARSGREAMHAYNDVFPGDLVDVPIRSLSLEATDNAVAWVRRSVEAEIYKAFLDRKDYVYCGLDQNTGDDFVMKLSWSGRPCDPEEFADGLPQGWMLYRLQDWIDGKMP